MDNRQLWTFFTIIIWSDYCRNSTCSIDKRRSFFSKKSVPGGGLHPPEKVRQAGHLQTRLKAAWWGPTPTESRRSTMAPRAYTFIRCKKSVGKVKAVQCATCKMWVHKECEELQIWRSDVAMPELPGQHSKTRGLTEGGGEKIEQCRGKREQR